MPTVSEDAPKDNKNLKRVIRTALQQWTPGITTTWTPAKVKSALTEHRLGDFGASSRLVDSMWEDSELEGSVDSAVNYIIGAAFRMEPVMVDEGDGEKPNPESEKMAKIFEERWQKAYPPSFMGRLVKWFLMLGVAPGTLDWPEQRSADGMWDPKGRTLHPENMRWDEEMVDQQGLKGAFKFHLRDGGETQITPGDGKWLLLSDGAQSWNNCGVRAVSNIWLKKQYDVRDWSRFNEKHGLPIVQLDVPVQADEAEKTGFFDDVKNLGGEGQVLAPKGFEPENPDFGFNLELKELRDNTWETFRGSIEYCDRKFQTYFLGTNTNELINSAGSRATSESGRSIAMNKALERWRRIQSDIRDQLLKPWIAVNFPSFDLELTPWPNYLIESDEDLLKRSETMKLFGEALGALSTAGYEVANLEEEAAQYGLKLTEKPSEPDPMAQKGTTGSPDQQKPSEGPQTASSELSLLDGQTPTVDQVGRREGFVAGQRYVEDLSDSLASEAETLEALDEVALLDIIEASTSPDDLKNRLEAHVKDSDPYQLGRLFEKAQFLSEMAGQYAVQEDL